LAARIGEGIDGQLLTPSDQPERSRRTP
jgi:hypothetical protein